MNTTLEDILRLLQLLFEVGVTLFFLSKLFNSTTELDALKYIGIIIVITTTWIVRAVDRSH